VRSLSNGLGTYLSEATVEVEVRPRDREMYHFSMAQGGLEVFFYALFVALFVDVY
jgi:hypothetical protein